MKKVLVIEDDRIWRGILVKLIKNAGYDVDTAKDGLEGLWKALSEKPDILVVDHILPRINGAHVIQFLRNDPSFKNSGMVLITSHEEIMNEYWAKEYGADEFIKKNEGIETIKKRLLEFLKGDFHTSKIPTEGKTVSLETLMGILDDELRHEKLNRDILELVEFIDDEEYIMRRIWNMIKQFGDVDTIYIMILTPAIGRLYAFSKERKSVNVQKLREDMLSLMKKPVTPSDWIFRGNVETTEDSETVKPSMVFPLEFHGVDIGVIMLEKVDIETRKIMLSLYKDLGESMGILAHTLNVFWEYRIASTVDSLTGLFVKKVILEKLQEYMSFSARDGMEFSIVMMDIDDFKSINDTYGHVVGDRVLREIGRMIKKTIREVDSAGRYGGEEFLILLPGTGIEGAKTMVERLLDTFRNTDWVKLAGVEKVTMSAGIALGDPKLSMTDLIKNADQALYRAKRSGKDRYAVYEEG